jgi:hypothetical protein
MWIGAREGGEIEGTLISISCDFASGGDGWVVKWVSAFPPVINAAAIEAPNRIDRHEGAMVGVGDLQKESV